MRDRSLSVADRFAAVGAMGLVAGTYLRWVRNPAPSTLGQIVPWEAAGFYPARTVLLVAPALYAVARLVGRRPRVETGLLAATALACVLYPPYRLTEGPQEFVPAGGFYLTAVAGLLFAATAAARYAEIRGFDRADGSSAGVVE